MTLKEKDNSCIIGKKLYDTISVQQLQDICQQASTRFLPIYHQTQPIHVGYKKDGSPVTNADTIAHHFISQQLTQYTPQWPVLSEESDAIDYNICKNWRTFWLIDPLDGTREFIQRHDNFSINIALIDNNLPVFGMIYFPLKQLYYFGGPLIYSAWKQHGESPLIPLQIGPSHQDTLRINISHQYADKTRRLLKHALTPFFKTVQIATQAGAIKGCRIAEGSVDLYSRFSPISEWDIAACHAIIKAAGGKIVHLNGQPLHYNLKENWLIQGFHAVGNASVHWDPIIKHLPSSL